ncbi:MAG: hypothetical protein ACREOC_02025 [Gemmatimonadales bacterium]
MPDYAAYRNGPASIPGIPAGAAAPPAFVNVVGEGFALPRTWKASVAYQRRVTDWLTLTGSLLASETDRNYYYVDRNLAAAPAFTLGNEAGRLRSRREIDSRGRTNVRNALRDPRLSRVLELVSIGEASQQSVVVAAAVRLLAGGSVWLAYTWTGRVTTRRTVAVWPGQRRRSPPCRVIRAICRDRGGRPTWTSATRWWWPQGRRSSGGSGLAPATSGGTAGRSPRW